MAQTGLGANPNVCIVGAGSVCLGVRRLGRDVDQTPPSSAEVKEIEELHLYSRSGLDGTFCGEMFLFSFTNTFIYLFFSV